MSSTSRHIPLFKCFFQAISWPKSWPRGSVHASCSASEADLVERTRQDMQTASIQTLVASSMPMWGFKVPKKSEHVEKHEPRYADVLDLWSIRGIETAKKLDLFQPKWGVSQPEMRVGQSIPIVDWLGNLGGNNPNVWFPMPAVVHLSTQCSEATRWWTSTCHLLHSFFSDYQYLPKNSKSK